MYADIASLDWRTKKTRTVTIILVRGSIGGVRNPVQVFDPVDPNAMAAVALFLT